MKKEKKDKDFVKSPYFEGGRQAIDAFVRKELKYPEAARKEGIEGTVTVRYTVDYKGHVIQAQVVSGLGYGCDEEALRVVRLMQFKVPEDGKVKSKYSRKLHIHFRIQAPLTAQTKPAAPPVIQYSVTPTRPMEAPKQPSGSIHYTIRFSPGTKTN